MCIGFGAENVSRQIFQRFPKIRVHNPVQNRVYNVVNKKTRYPKRNKTSFHGSTATPLSVWSATPGPNTMYRSPVQINETMNLNVRPHRNSIGFKGHFVHFCVFKVEAGLLITECPVFRVVETVLPDLDWYNIFWTSDRILPPNSRKRPIVSLTMVFEPSHEIMVLFVLRKLIFQTRMRSHPLGLDIGYLIGPFVHVCEQRRLWWDCADAQARLSLRWSPMW